MNKEKAADRLIQIQIEKRQHLIALMLIEIEQQTHRAAMQR